MIGEIGWWLAVIGAILFIVQLLARSVFGYEWTHRFIAVFMAGMVMIMVDSAGWI
jgi:uncharacterized membrane protein